MDIRRTIEPNSTQLNADELVSGPITVTITGVTQGSAEQPIDVHIAEIEGRAYRPGKTMRRLMALAWGTETDAWVGQALTLYRDPGVKFGRDEVGGIRISHMTGIDRPLDVALTATRGKRARHHVEPLTRPTAAPPVRHLTPEDIAACTSIEELRAMWQAASPDVQQLIQQRVEELRAQVATLPTPEPDEMEPPC